MALAVLESWWHTYNGHRIQFANRSTHFQVGRCPEGRELTHTGGKAGVWRIATFCLLDIFSEYRSLLGIFVNSLKESLPQISLTLESVKLLILEKKKNLFPLYASHTEKALVLQRFWGAVSWILRLLISQRLSHSIRMLFILLYLSYCLLNSGFDSGRKDHLVFPRFLICDDNSIFVECWCLFCPGISQYYCKTCCHQALLWWMTKVAAILFKGKQETYKKLLKRKWENNVQFQVAWQSNLLKLSTYLAENSSEKTSHPYLNSWSHNSLDRPFIWRD